MAQTKLYKIRQYINGKLFFYTQFRSTQKDYEAFKSILLFPKKGEIVEEGLVCKFVYYDNTTHKKKYFGKLVLDCSNSIFKEFGCGEAKALFRILEGRFYDDIRVDRLIVLFLGDKKLPNYLKKGNDYEKYISRYFSFQGYEVIENFNQGTEDEGIDIIATKGQELLLVQCKNWQVPLVTQKEIKEFLGSCYLFLYNHPHYRKYKVRRIFVSSSKELSFSAQKLLKANEPFVEFLYVPFRKNKLF